MELTLYRTSNAKEVCAGWRMAYATEKWLRRKRTGIRMVKGGKNISYIVQVMKLLI